MGARALASLFLIGAVVAVYGRVAGHELVDFDDYLYLRDNPWMQAPLDLDWIVRALREPIAAYWIPLTWLSFRLDYALFGGDPGAILLVNVALHAASTLLVLALFERMTGRMGASFFVASAFALHPLHVESVAWASERKDVLSTFFCLLGLFCHAAIHSPRRDGGVPARVPVRALELGVVASFALGLLAKPSLVSFPLALSVLDYWPLGRLAGRDAARSSPPVGIDPRLLLRTQLEKIPLYAMAAGSAFVVLSTQQSMGGTSFTAGRSLVDRIAQACESLVWYLARSVWPTGLSAFHPLELESPGRGPAVIAACLLLAICVLVARGMRGRPWLLAGWLWFLVHLAPVIGIVGVGMQAHADRWMYVPLLGLAWIVAFAGVELFSRARTPSSRALRSRMLVVACALAIVAWSVLSSRQVSTWRDTETLFRHALSVDPDNWYAHHRLAVLHRQRSQFEEAERHYIASLVALPGQARTQGELADVLASRGEQELADRLYANVPRTGFDDVRAARRLAGIFLAAGRVGSAIAVLERARTRRPDDRALERELERARSVADLAPGKT